MEKNHCFTIAFNSTNPNWVLESMCNMTNKDIINILLAQLERFHSSINNSMGLSADYIYRHFCIDAPSRDIYKYVWFRDDTFVYRVCYDDQADTYLINFYGATDITKES